MAMESSRKTQECFYVQELVKCFGDSLVYMHQLHQIYVTLYLLLSVM
jgi:hypothetical protein